MFLQRGPIFWLLALLTLFSLWFSGGCILTAENAGGYTITFGTTLDISSRSSTTDSKSTVKIDLAPTSEFIDAVTSDLGPNAAANTPRTIETADVETDAETP